MDREQLKRKAEAQLAAWEETAAELKIKVSEIGEDAREEYEARIQAVRSKQDDLRLKLNELRDTSDEAWDDLKVGFDAAWDDVEAAWADVRSAVTAAAARFGEADQKKKKKTAKAR